MGKLCAKDDLNLRQESLDALEKLNKFSKDCEGLWKYTLMCTDTPRPSGHCEMISARLIDIAKRLGLEYELDQAKNLVIRKPASKGHENAPGVCLQAHMDIVPAKDEERKNHDFQKDPVDVVIDGNWLKAAGTSLGADNGVGIGAILAFLEDDSLVHGPLEGLFTVDEETTMYGSEHLAPYPFIKSDILFNGDSEEEETICIGSAGGAENTWKLPVLWENTLADKKYAMLDLFLSGLSGGHSGVEIHLGRANSIKILARVLQGVFHSHSDTDIRLVEFSCLDGAPNAIPRSSFAKILVPVEEAEALLKTLQNTFEELQKVFLIVEGVLKEGETIKTSTMKLKMAKIMESVPQKAVSPACSRKIIDFIECMPNGVLRMSAAVSGLVETSTNFALCEIKSDHFFAHTFMRSSSVPQLTHEHRNLVSFARIAGAEVSEPLFPFAGWDPDVFSSSIALLKEIYMEVTTRAPKVCAFHAGLECGNIVGIYPKMDCVSIGPELRHPHSPDECVEIPSTVTFFKVARIFLEKVANMSKK